MIRPVIRLNVKKALLLAYVALGPLGNLLTPHFFPQSFRAYYFLLPFFPLFFTHVKERLAKVALFFLPFLLYSYISAFLVENFGEANEPYTVFRFCLLACQFFFVIGAASSLRTPEETWQVLRTYLKYFFVSMAIGYLFFFGYYAHIIPIEWIHRFSVLAQFGFGFLRFSPGSYPNEYGIVSSFVLCLLTLIYLDRKGEQFHLSNKKLLFLFLATFLAFLLTTTRAAYLSYFVCLIYLVWKSGKFFKMLFSFISFFLLFFSLLLLFKLNMFSIFTTGFSQRMDEGSLGERYFMWLESIERTEGHNFWGVGFGSLTNIHNVYLQLAFELGLAGSLFFVATLILVFLESYGKYKKREYEKDPFLKKVQMVGLINVLSFAASNHNLNHHLTWFVFFLCLIPILNKRPALSLKGAGTEAADNSMTVRSSQIESK